MYAKKWEEKKWERGYVGFILSVSSMIVKKENDESSEREL